MWLFADIIIACTGDLVMTSDMDPSYIQANCKTITTLTVNEDVETIEGSMCFSFGQLQKVTFLGKTTIGSNSFADCTSLREIVFSSSCSIVQGPICSPSSSLSFSFPVPNPNIDFYDGCLYSTTSDLQCLIFMNIGRKGDYIVPDNITKLGSLCCYRCLSLGVVTFHDHMESIEDSCLVTTSTTKIIFPQNDLKFSLSTEWTLVFNKNLIWVSPNPKILIMPEGITSLQWNCCTSGKNLEFVKICSTVTRLGHQIFQGNSNIRVLQIPSSIKTIESGAFWRSIIKQIQFLGFLNQTQIGVDSFETAIQISSISLACGDSFTQTVNPTIPARTRILQRCSFTQAKKSTKNKKCIALMMFVI